MVKKTCKFFALGTCTRGQACTYSHEVTSSGGLPSGAAPFVPLPHFTPSQTSPTSSTETNGIPCRFNLLGRCNKGIDCPYEHLNGNTSTSDAKQMAQPEGDNAPPPEPIHVQDPNNKSYPAVASEQSTRELEARNLRGASVMFGPGAQVHDVEFSSDYSAVQMTSLQPNCDAEAFQGYLAALGETVPLSLIRVKTVTKPPSVVANARIRDSGFAQRLKLKADMGADGINVSEIAVSILQVGIKSESSANRLQMNTVSCTWYKPSRVAWLHYNNIGKARATQKFIASRDFRIAGRKIQATLHVPEHRFGHRQPTITSVQLGNLDASTSQPMIERHIPGHLTPVNVIMGKTSYSTSLHEAEESVKALLNGVGSLEAWEPNSTTSSTQVKAIARFQTGEHARKAVNQLSGQKMPQLANSKFFVSPLISVKFNVPRAMYTAIRGDVDRLKSQIWDAGHVHIKAYPPVDPTQKLIALRLYGEDAKAVAKAKSAFEKILAGDVAMNGDLGIWDDFFTNPEGLAYLNELGHTRQGYIYRDMRKHRISLYGSVDSKEYIRGALIQKLDILKEMTYYISLGAEDLKRALHGGFRRIVATFGKHKASLDIRQRPQTITIIGSARDLETARALLDQDVASNLETLVLSEDTDHPDCAVCWTEAEDAYRTPCGHFYCGSCLASQCSSAGEGNLPVRCFGDSGDCLKVLAIQELKTALPPDGFEQLLEDSFTTHVRTNPKSFQYCPTPDCQQIYRVSTDGLIFTCPACLTPICTTCQITSHDGMTCELYKRIGTEGNEEFQKWKQENNVKDCPVCKVESRILNRAENLAKLTAAVLNLERSDHLLLRGRGQLLEDEKLFRELSNVINVLISDLAEKTSLRLGDTTHELKRIEQQRRQGETKLQDHLSMVERIYTYGDELEIPKELRLWSMVTHIPHARLIDVHDRYDASVQIPAAYPTLLDPLERNDEAVLKPLMRWYKDPGDRFDAMKALDMSPIEYHMYSKRQTQPSPPGQVGGSERSGILTSPVTSAKRLSEGDRKSKQL